MTAERVRFQRAQDGLDRGALGGFGMERIQAARGVVRAAPRFQVPLDLGREAREQAREARRSRAGMGAVAVVRHEPRRLAQVLHVLRPRPAAFQRAQDAGEVRGSRRAGRTLAAGLALEEGRRGQPDGQRAGRLSDDQDGRGAEGRSGLAQGVRIERGVRLLGSERRP